VRRRAPSHRKGIEKEREREEEQVEKFNDVDKSINRVGRHGFPNHTDTRRQTKRERAKGKKFMRQGLKTKSNE